MPHTPAPWLYRGKSSTVHKPCATHPYGDQIFGFHDAEFDDRTPSDGDLQLILLAPELREELRYLVNTLQKPPTGPNGTHVIDLKRAVQLLARTI